MLINCVAYKDGSKLGDVPIDDISDYIAQPGCFVWVALKDATPEELSKMQEEFGLHELAIEDARHGHQRPKIEEYDDTLFAVLHTVEIGPTDDLVIGEVDIFVGTNFVLSCRNRTQQGFLGVRARAEREPHLLKHGPAFVFYALMDAVVDRYFPIIDALETDLEVVEEQIFEPRLGRANIEQLYALKRRIGVFKHAVAPLQEAVAKLVAGRVPQVCSDNREYFRDVYDHLARMNTSLDSLRDTIAHRDAGQPLDGDDRGDRDHQAARRLCRHLRGRDRVRRHLGHELRAHARAQADLGLPGGAGDHRRRLRLRLVAIPQGRLALTGAPDAASGRRRFHVLGRRAHRRLDGGLGHRLDIAGRRSCRHRRSPSPPCPRASP